MAKAWAQDKFAVLDSLYQNFTTYQVHSERFSISDTCSIQERRGFLKNVCFKDDCRDPLECTEYLKCAVSEDYYFFGGSGSAGTVCSNDPHFYMLCGSERQGKVTNNNLLCEHYVCDTGRYFHRSSVYMHQETCDGKKDCLNTDLDEANCSVSSKIRLPSGEMVSAHSVCNDECSHNDGVFCEDEANCNGYSYGVYCEDGWQKYIAPTDICKGNYFCESGEHMVNCEVTDSSEYTCNHFWLLEPVPIFNYTRCGVMQKDIEGTIYPYCDNFMDQTNCSDSARIGGGCKVNGFVSTISKYIICQDEIATKICDDSLEAKCVQTSPTCFLHKHRMCDQINDCGDGSDESILICDSMTLET